MDGTSAGQGSPTSIRVLILEDHPADAELMVHELRRSWLEPECERVETEVGYLMGLKSLPDVILSDYQMPQFDAVRALQLLREHGLDIPLIVVSGAFGEDVAVAMMREGASDYLLKDRMARLGPAVRRALEQRRVRAETRRAEEALRASEVRFYSFMDHNPALAFIKDESGRILYMNNTCERVLDTTLAECEGKRDDELWPADVAARLRANDLAVFGGRAFRFLEEIPLRDGRYLQLLSFRFPFADLSGQRILGGVSVDISEQLRVQKELSAALAAKEVLLREVHHRVKNNLQIISSLLSMQAELLKGSAAAQALQDGQRRVQCMAMVHDRLQSDQDIEQLDFREFAESLVRDLFYCHAVDSGRIGLRLELDAVTLKLHQAIPCGLVLNELVTNAVKYAFGDGRGGTIAVSFRPVGADFELDIADDGSGIPPTPGRDSGKR